MSSESEHIGVGLPFLVPRDALLALAFLNGAREIVERSTGFGYVPELNAARQRALDIVAEGRARSDESIVALIDDIREWQAMTFPHRTSHSTATHLLKEAHELAASPDDREERADVFLLLVANAMRDDPAEFFRDVRAKLEKNKRRTWGLPDAYGVVEHTAEGDV